MKVELKLTSGLRDIRSSFDSRGMFFVLGLP